tara:strand:- start:122749 stop:124185 length:1437 start_codon:yes stop_codon:yes gene_type:complete
MPYINSIMFLPELILTIGTLFILTVSTFLKNISFKFSFNASILLLVFSLYSVTFDIDTNLFNYDNFFDNGAFIDFIKILILFGTLVFFLFSEEYFYDLNLDKFEIPILILFSVLGMMIMISCNNLISMYLGIELQSLSLYILASINKKSIKSTEAGLKYFILGALSSGILLYGCSLIYGFTGALNFQEIELKLSVLPQLDLGLIFGLVFIIVSLAFKVSAVPFHMWTPDVYEGSPTPITAFFAIVTKIVAVGLLIRFLILPFGQFVDDWSQIIIFLSISSMILGALAAMTQNNIKRLLAYSSIGHIGYMLIGLATGAETGIRGIIIYLCIYLFMNAAVFTILLSIKINGKYIENIKSFAGLSKKYPIISFIISIMMFSMAGIPPFAGFFSKFYIFISALESKLVFLAIIGVLSSVVAAFYYIRIVKIIYFDDGLDNFEVILNFRRKLIIFISTIFIAFFIIAPSYIIDTAQELSKTIF